MCPTTVSRNYSHPFTPYDIQLELMDAIYDTIENGYKVGLFESPTGTGKTLSIICSTMTWLRNYKRNHVFDADADSEESSDDEPEWVKSAYRSSIVDKSKEKLKEFELHLNEVEASHGAKVRAESSIKLKVKRRQEGNKEEEFLPEDYHSDTESKSIEAKNVKLNNEINRLMHREESESKEYNCKTKILFSSRTHSQLNQFSSQLRLTTFDASFDNMSERTKYLPIGSRKQLCINEKVSKRGDQSINDACIDLQKTKEGCNYLTKDQSLVKEFSDLSLSQIRDIEDLAILGTELHACPYYSVRKGLGSAEIVSLPYQLLFQKSAREAWGIDLKDTIVIIDEAHNVIDSITSLYSVKITISQLHKVMQSLKIYMTKFAKRLNSGNRINIIKLTKICKVLANFMESKSPTPGNEVHVEDIFQNSTGDLVNIHKLDEYLTKSKIAYKIESYIEKTDAVQASASPVLFEIAKFLRALTNPRKEGKFYWDKTANEFELRYMLLDPSVIFNEIVTESKCVLLCGGTMEPMTDFTEFLMPQVSKNQIKMFSCQHIIPKNNLEVFAVDNWGSEFDFSYQKRDDTSQMDRLGQFILQVCQVVPHGVVVFLSSYNFLYKVLQQWQRTNTFQKISALKTIFQEPTNSSNVDSILFDYSNAINCQKKGAILFSVVGGKLSEGINFSDNLARAVIMVGMPYPNAFSGEIVAKRAFIEKQVIEKGGTSQRAKECSNEYYENLCMKAINQSVGRCIRHANDYALIYLVDKRYKQSRIQNKLSKWVKDRLVSSTDVVNSSVRFFQNK
ncbi:CHL1 [Candida metapsilosis]|uniref:ATP-dependent DNA helicase CHL1 n=1 Tax=Candida metapsilosis TaxID=273372 RepID=A0A8H7ZDN3_9ASCO|nr:CHL1 [Candida metapsilosis]